MQYRIAILIHYFAITLHLIRQVQINLGAGEPQLPAPKGLRLDDLIWHQIALNRKDGEINVTIDKIHVIRYIHAINILVQ